MTTQEQQRLARLVERIAAQPDVPKDVDAVIALAHLLRQRPDAAYWLLRRCLLLEAAIEGAQVENAPASPAAEPELRDMLGEFASTTMLGDLSDLSDPKPLPRPPRGPRRH